MKKGIHNNFLLQLMQAGKAQNTDYENSDDIELKARGNNDYNDKFQGSYNQNNQQPFVNNKLALDDHNEPTIKINSNNGYYYTEQFNELFKKFHFGFFTEYFKWDLSSYWPSMLTKYNRLDAIKCLDELEDKSNNSEVDTIIIIGDKYSGAFSIDLESEHTQKNKKKHFNFFKKAILEDSSTRRSHNMSTYNVYPPGIMKLEIAMAVSCAWNHEDFIRKEVKEWSSHGRNSKG